LVSVLDQRYPVLASMDIVLKAGPAGKLRVSGGGGRWTIAAGTVSGFARGIGHALSGIPAEETTPFRTIGFMIDCSRNKVHTVDFLKDLLAYAALCGFNMAMLYTEDTYSLPDEPMFGFMRGGYMAEEIRTLDGFAGSLGIELCACIQTLGHLTEVLKWSNFTPCRDTGSVLLSDAPETYALIEKMLLFWKENLRSRRIHIGMDEAHDLGRGKFMDLHGAGNAFEIFNRHLGRVNALCRKLELQPMIWSDMYFRMGSETGSYYDPESRIPESTINSIPEGVRLCYWDYYHADGDFYRTFLRKHQEIRPGTVMASGIWTWSRIWYDHYQTRKTVVPCVEACRQEGIDEIFFTMWGDNGAYCLFESILAGLEFTSGLLYGEDAGNEDLFRARLKSLCGRDYDAWTAVSGLFDQEKHGWLDTTVPMPEKMIWDDPLQGQYFCMEESLQPGILDKMTALLEDSCRKWESMQEKDPSLEVIRAMYLAAAGKVRLYQELNRAYSTGDTARLRTLADGDIPELIRRMEAYTLAFRGNWLKHAKSFGLEVIQRRNAGCIARLQEAGLRIHEFLDGKTDAIGEIDMRLAYTGKLNDFRLYSGSSIL